MSPIHSGSGATGGSSPIPEETLADLELVEQAMRDQLAVGQDLINSIGGHTLSSGGKRLRPALVLLSAELCGYTGPRRIEVAAAIELLHTATLMHDDVVDFAELRRGRPSVNAIWGNRRAVLVGDFFYARASSVIVDDGDIGILGIFADTIRHMAEGELLQLQRSFDPGVTESHYYAVINRKSAALLSAACEVGALLGGVTRSERRRLAEFGRELGLAFQLRDDALDYEAREAELGKQPFTDLLEGKVTLPLLLTLKRSTSAEREQIGAALKQAARRADATAPDRGEADEAPIDTAAILELVTRHRGIVDTVRRAEEHVQRAISSIAAFPDNAAKRALLSSAMFAVSRDR